MCAGQLCNSSVHVCHDSTHIPNPSICLHRQFASSYCPLPHVWVSECKKTLTFFYSIISVLSILERIIVLVVHCHKKSELIDSAQETGNPSNGRPYFNSTF